MSKLTFRSRTLDAGRPMPIYRCEELPDLQEVCGINRSVPQMPSGMEKEEETKHDLRQAICTGHIIPTPEVTSVEVSEAHRIQLSPFKIPRQLIHMEPFAMEHDYPDYDMDSEDEMFVNQQDEKLTALKFEEIMDRLEKSSGQKVVTLQEAKQLIKEDDDLIIAVYDYWLNKKLKTQVPLIPCVRTVGRHGFAKNPYVAFRKRTEKMQTRKNRKNDEASFEKMLKLKRDLSRTLTLLDLVKQREVLKGLFLRTQVDIIDKRYVGCDFSGSLLSEVSAIKVPRPAFAPIFSNRFSSLGHSSWSSLSSSSKMDGHFTQKERKQYKRRKHRATRSGASNHRGMKVHNSSEEELERPRSIARLEDIEGPFAFRRKSGVRYLPAVPLNSLHYPEDKEERFRFFPTALKTPRPRFVGFCRRRVGRGGRMILDRVVQLGDGMKVDPNQVYRPVTPPNAHGQTLEPSPAYLSSLPNTLTFDVELAEGCDSRLFPLKKAAPEIGGIDLTPSCEKPKELDGCVTFNLNNDVNFDSKERAEFPWGDDFLGQPLCSTLELYLPDVFANTPVQATAPAELEASDDSFGIFEKLGLDEDFIRKEPTSLNDKTPKLPKKVDKNIFEFSETDFLKYETDCDVDDLEPVLQADVVGCSSLFSRGPNSRFNMIPTKYIPFESEKVKSEPAKVSPEKPPPKSSKTVAASPKPKSKQKTKIKSKSRSVHSMKSHTSGRSRGPATQSALNHHNYTIASPPPNSKVNKSTVTCASGSRPVYSPTTSLLSKQLTKPQVWKPKTPRATTPPAAATTRTVGVTKVKALSGGKVTQKVTPPSQSLNSESSIAALLREQTFAPSMSNINRSLRSSNDTGVRSSSQGIDSRRKPSTLRTPSVVLPRPVATSAQSFVGSQTFQNKNLLSGSQTMTLATLLAGDGPNTFQDLSNSQRTSLLTPRVQQSKDSVLKNNSASSNLGVATKEEDDGKDGGVQKSTPQPMEVS